MADRIGDSLGNGTASSFGDGRGVGRMGRSGELSVAEERVDVGSDPRVALFASVAGRVFSAEVIAEQEGVFCGSTRLRDAADHLGLRGTLFVDDGDAVRRGMVVARYLGTALQIARAEEQLLGVISKTSGIATAARAAVVAARGAARVVCGAWKKMPIALKEPIREAIRAGGAAVRICDEPFLYVDKNFVRILGGLDRALAAAKSFEGRTVVVQLKGEWGPLEQEVTECAASGVGVVMIDTGDLGDLVRVRGVIDRLRSPRPKLAFGGGVTIGQIPAVCSAGADIIDVGRAIVDAPLLSFRLEVERGWGGLGA